MEQQTETNTNHYVMRTFEVKSEPSRLVSIADNQNYSRGQAGSGGYPPRVLDE